MSRTPLALLMLAVFAPSALAVQVQVEALFTNAAVLRIDGEQKMLRAGQSHRGVTLVAADSAAAVLDIRGERHEVGVHRGIGTQYFEPEQRTVEIPRNAQRQYITRASINGVSMAVLVDTGANVMALNAAQASTLRLNLDDAQPARVTTASGVVRGWRVSLRSVEVGGIRVDNVDATVLEGEQPETPLLGMSFLSHVDINESNGILRLTRDF